MRRFSFAAQQQAAGFFGIVGDGLPQGFHIGEAALRAQKMTQGNGELLPVQVAGKIEKIAFHPQGACRFHGGADAEIGDSGTPGAIWQGDPRGVNAKGGDLLAGGDNNIGGGEAKGMAQAVAGDNPTGKGEQFFNKITGAAAAKRSCKPGRLRWR